MEAFRSDGSSFTAEQCRAVGFEYGEYNGSNKVPLVERDEALPFPYSVGGPLCFQGDFLVKNTRLPPVKAGDLIVLKDVGAYSMSMFSHHCSRLCPAVYGFRWNKDGQNSESKVTFHLLKPQQTYQSLNQFWGPLLPA